MKHLRLLATTAAAGICLLASLSFADPCLVVYPAGPCTYHYSPTKYYTVGPGHPLYDPLYARGGQVLLTAGGNSIDLSVYQPPQLVGFVADTSEEGFYFDGDNFDLTIDGFSNSPTAYVNILLVFDRPQPSGCSPTITVDGVPVVGGKIAVGDLAVQTPAGYGNNYSDVMTRHVTWSGCAGLRVWAFSDVDHNGVRTGGECFTAFSHDSVVPVDGAAWGAVKSLYR